MALKYFAITSESGVDLGIWEASSEDEALEMLAIDGGYASREEADEVVFEATGRYPEPTVEVVSPEEVMEIEDLISEGMSQYHALDVVKSRRERR